MRQGYTGAPFLASRQLQSRFNRNMHGAGKHPVICSSFEPADISHRLGSISATHINDEPCNMHDFLLAEAAAVHAVMSAFWQERFGPGDILRS